MMTAPMPAPPVEKTAKPTIAGVLLILALLKDFIVLPAAIALLAAGTTFSSMIPGLGMFAALGAMFLALTILGLVGCLLAMIFAFTRKKHMIAVVGCVLAIVGTNLILGIIALVLVLMSKKEFTS